MCNLFILHFISENQNHVNLFNKLESLADIWGACSPLAQW